MLPGKQNCSHCLTLAGVQSDVSILHLQRKRRSCNRPAGSIQQPPPPVCIGAGHRVTGGPKALTGRFHWAQAHVRTLWQPQVRGALRRRRAARRFAARRGRRRQAHGCRPAVHHPEGAVLSVWGIASGSCHTTQKAQCSGYSARPWTRSTPFARCGVRSSGCRRWW